MDLMMARFFWGLNSINIITIIIIVVVIIILVDEMKYHVCLMFASRN